MLFAQYREIVLSEAIRLEVKDAEYLTVGELRKTIGRQYGALSPYVGSALFAVNEEIATDETQIRQGDIVAAMPPVSGGLCL